MGSGYYLELIRSPVVTEKSSKLMAENKFIFKISMFANKLEIKKAIEDIFNVKVVKVNIFNRKGKVKTFRGHKGKRNNQKYAVVTLESGQNIDLGIGA